VGVAAGGHAARLNDGGSHADGIITMMNHVAQNVQLTLKPTRLGSGGHHAAGTWPSDPYHRVTDAKKLANPPVARLVLTRAEDDVRSKAADIPRQVGSLSLK
jgi:hypothetical protein